MKLIVSRLSSALALLALLVAPAAVEAGQQKPLVSKSGQTQQIQAGDTLLLPPATVSSASINIPHGTAPSAPSNGDCWTTSAGGLSCRINGVTVPVTHVTQAGTGAVSRAISSRASDILAAGDFGTTAQAITQATSAGVPVVVPPTLNVGTTCTDTATIASGTYTSATGAVSLTISGWSGSNGVGYTIYVGNLTGTGSVTSLGGNRVTTSGSTGKTVNFTAASGLGSITITGGKLFGLPGIACNGGNLRSGLQTGNLALGNQLSAVDAFVNIHSDDLSVNSQQEMRGLTVTRRYYRTTPDEVLLGWDNIPGVFANVVTASNSQNLVGNMKGVVSELYFQGPPAATYSSRNQYNYQATIVELGSNITLTNWQGLIISATPTGGGTITNGYGIEIGAITATNAAAIKLDAQGAGGQIKWPNTAVYEDTGSKLTFDFGTAQMPVLLNGKFTTSAVVGGASALPATPSGYWSVLIGGNERKIPYYN